MGSGLPKVWSAQAKTDQFGNTKKPQSWWPWNQESEEDHTALLSSGPIMPQKLFKRQSPEEEANKRLDEQLAVGNSHEQANQWEKAKKVYEQLSREQPEVAPVWHRLAVVNDRLKRHTEAQRLYREALKHDPGNAQLYNDLGYSHFLQGELQEAKLALTKAVQLAPQTSRFHNNLGMVIGHQGKYDEALKEFRRAGSDADAYFNLAFVYASQENSEQAKTCFQQALAVDPAHGKSREALLSFERYERTPQELRDDLDTPESAATGRWVAFVEGAKDHNSEVVTAGGENSNAAAHGSSIMRDSNVQAASGTKSFSASRYAAGQSQQVKSAQNTHFHSQRAAEGVPYSP